MSSLALWTMFLNCENCRGKYNRLIVLILFLADDWHCHWHFSRILEDKLILKSLNSSYNNVIVNSFHKQKPCFKAICQKMYNHIWNHFKLLNISYLYCFLNNNELSNKISIDSPKRKRIRSIKIENKLKFFKKVVFS